MSIPPTWTGSQQGQRPAAAHQLAEDRVLAVEVFAGAVGDVELGLVAVRPAVGHGQNSPPSVAGQQGVHYSDFTLASSTCTGV